MIETITPAVCGSRSRHRIAVAGFALGALLASALVGALLGLAGNALGAERTVVLAAALALLAAAREAGLVRLPLPQSRRQVPERWRAQLPLPLWSMGYGAGLGAGFATFQPLATFWVACAAALALARPLPAALCFALYGAGRSLTLVWPRRKEESVTAVVEALARRRGTLARANVAALVACAALLALAPAAEATPFPLGSGLDPSVSAGVLARTQVVAGVSSVVIEPPDAAAIQIDGASSPALDGDLVAYVDAQGIRVLNWRTGAEAARVDQAAGMVSKPALAWPLLAFQRHDGASKRLVLRDLAAGSEQQITAVAGTDDLGRPSLHTSRLAWHVSTRRASRVVLMNLATGRRTLVARSRIAVVANPSLSRSRVLWIEQRSDGSRLRVRRISPRMAPRTLWKVGRRDRLFWTTELAGRTAYVTRWELRTGRSILYRLGL